jgi:hypothetical protein
MCPNGYFWIENIPSGNPDSEGRFLKHDIAHADTGEGWPLLVNLAPKDELRFHGMN